MTAAQRAATDLDNDGPLGQRAMDLDGLEEEDDDFGGDGGGGSDGHYSSQAIA